MYLIKSGCHYVKAIDGKPCYRSTQDESEAARFATEAEAREWAPNVFAKSMLAAVEIAEESGRDLPQGTMHRSPLDRAIERGGIAWTYREDADEVIFGGH